MSEKPSDSRPLPKSYFWTHGITPMAVGMVKSPVPVPPRTVAGGGTKTAYKGCFLVVVDPLPLMGLTGYIYGV